MNVAVSPTTVPYVATVVILMLSVVILAGWACVGAMQGLVTPRVQDADLRKLPPSAVWSPGDPVREVPDLKRTDAAASSVTFRSHILRVVDRNLVVLAADGSRIAGPLAFGSLWGAAAEPCGVDVESPPRVSVDHDAGRWLIWRVFQPLASGEVPFCLAVSKTADPVTGGWWLYNFSLPAGNYDAHQLLVSTKTYRFAPPSGLTGAEISFDRTALLSGKPAAFSRLAR